MGVDRLESHGEEVGVEEGGLEVMQDAAGVNSTKRVRCAERGRRKIHGLELRVQGSGFRV